MAGKSKDFYPRSLSRLMPSVMEGFELSQVAWPCQLGPCAPSEATPVGGGQGSDLWHLMPGISLCGVAGQGLKLGGTSRIPSGCPDRGKVGQVRS